jgi:hypothetical protein
MARPCSATDGGGIARERSADADSSVIWFAQECARNGVSLDGCIHSAPRSGDLALTHARRAKDA